jgi:hypothetical protein
MDFIFDPSLVLYLPLYELDGSSFRSKDAYGCVSTVTGAVWTPRGRSFDGIDDSITAPYYQGLGLTQAVTVEAIIMPKQTKEYGVIVIKQTNQYIFDLHNDYARFDFYAAASWHTQQDASHLISQNIWHHLCVTYDRNKVKMYDQGELFYSNSETTAMPSSSGQLLINGAIGGNALQCELGELRIYSRALNPTEIQHNYLATKWRYR